MDLNKVLVQQSVNFIARYSTVGVGVGVEVIVGVNVGVGVIVGVGVNVGVIVGVGVGVFDGPPHGNAAKHASHLP